MTSLLDQVSAQDFDHVWTIVDGSVIDVKGEYAPEMTMFETESGSWEDDNAPEGWDFLTYGMTGQYGYNGPWMHSSETPGRGMIEHIVENLDSYSCFAFVYPSMIALDEDEEVEPEGWAIVGKIIN